ncbi:unnamed protein product [Calypogeia fissa]
MEVDRYREGVCSSRDEFGRCSMAEGSGMAKSFGDLSRSNVCYAENENVCVRPLGDDEAVYLKGDVTIIDPFKIFFRNPESVLRMGKLRQQLQDLQQEGHWEFLVMYRGEAAYFISSESWDQESAFEISRNGSSLGVDEVPSRFIAVVTKKMVDLLLEENGEGVNLEGGVSVQGVDGQLIRSGDGDFVISGSGAVSPVRKVSRWIEDECVRNADILCAAGGRWTFCDDSSDEEDEDEEFPTDEELRKFLEHEDVDCEWKM